MAYKSRAEAKTGKSGYKKRPSGGSSPVALRWNNASVKWNNTSIKFNATTYTP